MNDLPQQQHYLNLQQHSLTDVPMNQSPSTHDRIFGGADIEKKRPGKTLGKRSSPRKDRLRIVQESQSEAKSDDDDDDDDDESFVPQIHQAAKDTMTNYVVVLQEVTCAFCGGWGHMLKKCSTKKALDKFAANCKELKVSWGGMKSNFVEAQIKKAMVKGTVGRRKGKRVDKAAMKEEQLRMWRS